MESIPSILSVHSLRAAAALFRPHVRNHRITRGTDARAQNDRYRRQKQSLAHVAILPAGREIAAGTEKSEIWKKQRGPRPASFHRTSYDETSGMISFCLSGFHPLS
ncbi:MAG: hypothetical protein ACOX5G_03865 [Kiritimatiellia bacterium]|jgi:hypothetical protein